MATLTPAYGRDYKSAAAARLDFEAGKDFILNDVSSPWNGKACSIRDFPGQEVNIRYLRKTRVTVVRVKEAK